MGGHFQALARDGARPSRGCWGCVRGGRVGAGYTAGVGEGECFYCVFLRVPCGWRWCGPGVPEVFVAYGGPSLGCEVLGSRRCRFIALWTEGGVIDCVAASVGFAKCATLAVSALPVCVVSCLSEDFFCVGVSGGCFKLVFFLRFSVWCVFLRGGGEGFAYIVCLLRGVMVTYRLVLFFRIGLSTRGLVCRSALRDRVGFRRKCSTVSPSCSSGRSQLSDLIALLGITTASSLCVVGSMAIGKYTSPRKCAA